MSPFTPKEIFRALCIGVAFFFIGVLMAAAGALCLGRGIGTPEYITCLRNTGWTLIALSVLWTSLAAFRKLTLQ